MRAICLSSVVENKQSDVLEQPHDRAERILDLEFGGQGSILAVT